MSGIYKQYKEVKLNPRSSKEAFDVNGLKYLLWFFVNFINGIGVIVIAKNGLCKLKGTSFFS